MLTRLQVSGFKNLVDVNVHFGPFTCIAGPNGVGKSNLFDAILFISALTDRTLAEAALSVRSEAERTGDIQGIFHRVGNRRDEKMRFEADMILPPAGVDELGQPVEGSSTFVRYSLVLGLRPENSPDREAGALELIEESLVPLRLTDAPQHLLFPHSVEWRKSVLKGRHTAKFISTEGEDSQRTVRLHQDGRSGRLFKRPATSLRRTLLSTVQAGEYPTAMLVRREMQSWRMLHLESSALRRPDPFTAPTKMTPEGAHLPAALNQLSRHDGIGANGNGHATKGKETALRVKETAVLANVANRLAELIDDVREVRVDRDETRQLFTVQVTTRDGTIHPASALSDGTLRFLALAVTEFDRQSGGVLCFEEPENGIHPRRIHSMLRLLQDIATDTDLPVEEDNPLRQVIINTHSPSVVLQTPEESLLVAELAGGIQPASRQGGAQLVRFSQLLFSCLEGSWRQNIKGHRITGKGNLLAYLNPSAAERDADVTKKRVMDRSDLQMLFTFPSGA
jgi:predicted ATPase